MVDIIGEGTYEQCRAVLATLTDWSVGTMADMVGHDNARRAVADEIAAREARTVRPLDITLDLEPTDYGTLASPQGLFRGRPALLLRLTGGNGRYGTMFSVLYTKGTTRTDAALIPQASVIAARGTGAPKPIVHDVQVGDVVIIDSHRLTIMDGTFSNYPTMVEAHRMTVADAQMQAGCWLEGSRGWTASGELVNIADHNGMPLDDDDRAIVAHYLANNDGPLTLSTGQVVTDVHELVTGQGELADKAESYLNDHVAPEGYSFGWNDGEFVLWSDESWQEDGQH